MHPCNMHIQISLSYLRIWALAKFDPTVWLTLREGVNFVRLCVSEGVTKRTGSQHGGGGSTQDDPRLFDMHLLITLQ